MNTINIDKTNDKEFKILGPLKLHYGIFNTEGQIYCVNYQNKSMTFIYKQFYNLEKSFLTNKVNTLLSLDRNRKVLPDYLAIPQALVQKNNKICGYIMPYFKGTNLATLLDNKSIHYKKIIAIFEQIGKILDELNQLRQKSLVKNFYINDLHSCNFLYDTNKDEIKIVDLDSVKIENNLACMSRYLTYGSLASRVPSKYPGSNLPPNYAFIEPNNNSEIYCYCMMILNYLYDFNVNTMSISNFEKYLDYLNSLKINKNLLDCFYSLVTPNDNKNPKDYLNTLTERQIKKAVCSEYLRKVKK